MKRLFEVKIPGIWAIGGKATRYHFFPKDSENRASLCSRHDYMSREWEERREVTVAFKCATCSKILERHKDKKYREELEEIQSKMREAGNGLLDSIKSEITVCVLTVNTERLSRLLSIIQSHLNSEMVYAILEAGYGDQLKLLLYEACKAQNEEDDTVTY